LGGHTASNSGFAMDHDSSPFKTSISMLIPLFLQCATLLSHASVKPWAAAPAVFQIQVFNPNGTFYKGCR
jgi:hypothetical protein